MIKIKDWEISFGCDWISDIGYYMINIELLSFHLERNYFTQKIEEVWFSFLGFTIFFIREVNNG